MSWYQCKCGFLTERAAQLGDTVVSVYHLHQSARLDGTAAIVRMEDVPAPAATGGYDSSAMPVSHGCVLAP